MKRLWRWLFDRPYHAYGRSFRTEEALSRYVWKESLRD